MRGGLPKKEPELLARWREIDLYRRLHEAGRGKPKFVLHDGPPYANGNIHIGHALNKILKDLVTRSQRMLGKDSNYVPGWDCHGLPIEWKIEENYRAKGKNKDSVPINEFRHECRVFAEHWVEVQKEEFKRLGVIGDWDHPYLTMSFAAEAQIAREIMKFATNGTLYRGSKPVMWSVVEKTALAEAEVEYEDHVSDVVWVKFPVKGRTAREGLSTVGHKPPIQPLGADQSVAGNWPGYENVAVVIWTTTPWTLPANRAISFSSKISYGLYVIGAGASPDNWAKPGQKYIVADTLAGDVFKAARVDPTHVTRERDVPNDELELLVMSHPLAGRDSRYDFDVPLLDGDHVTDDTGTGFVHTAPSHGRDDFDIWMAHGRELIERGIDTRIPYTVDADGFFTSEAPGFTGRRVIDDKGNKGDANEAVIKALIDSGNLVARGKLKHQYPHSWRSKKPVIFRNTPQWFIALDKPIGGAGTLREIALHEIALTKWYPPAGENRITGMIANRPDWVVSRQRAWGVPIAIFVDRETKQILIDDKVNQRIAEAFEQEGADAWFAPGAAAQFLTPEYEPEKYEKIDDVLDVWFNSGSNSCLHAGRSQTLPGSRGHSPYSRRRARRNPLSRRLRPASRLVSFLAAQILWHARTCAL